MDIEAETKPEPELNEIRSGRHVGQKTGAWYVWWECPHCKRRGWANLAKLAFNPDLGLCHTCYEHSSKYHNLICDKIKSLSSIPAKPTLKYSGMSFYFFPEGALKAVEADDKKHGRRKLGDYIQVYQTDWFNDNSESVVTKWGLEHIYIVEKRIGHKIPKGMIVHHLDGVKTNNTPDNLTNPMTRKEHKLIIPLYRSRIQQLEAKVLSLQNYIGELEELVASR